MLEELWFATDGAGHDPANQWPRNKNWIRNDRRGHWECVTEHELDAGAVGGLLKALDLSDNNLQGVVSKEGSTKSRSECKRTLALNDPARCQPQTNI